MCKDETLDRVLGSIESLGFPSDKLSRTSTIPAIGLDEFDEFDLLTQLEKEFKQDLEYWQFDKWQTIDDICKTLEGH